MATEDGYDSTEQQVFSPQWNEKTDYAQDFANATRFYEGALLMVGDISSIQTTSDGLNYDIYLLDTRTGERRQLTTDLDYNRSVTSARTARRCTSVQLVVWIGWTSSAALQRPSLIDVVAFPQMGRVGLWNNRRSLNEPWLMDLSVGQQLGSYSGQPIIIDPDWTIRGWSWFPDSTRAVINEQQRPDAVTPRAPDTPWRVSIISFPTRRNGRTWNQSIRIKRQSHYSRFGQGLQPDGRSPRAAAGLKGTYSGTATLQYIGIFGFGTYSVTYKNYSDDGKTFINGTEGVNIYNPMGNAVWSANLTSEGERSTT